MTDHRYEVSDDGRVRSLWFRNGRADRPRAVPLFMKGIVQSRGGYVHVMLSGRRQLSVHRMVLETFVGPRPPGMEACHSNGNPADNRLSNLRWGSRLDNAADRDAHGRTARGERNGCAKLSAEQVADIRASNERGVDLARRYGVTKSQISAVRTHRKWKPGKEEVIG